MTWPPRNVRPRNGLTCRWYPSGLLWTQDGRWRCFSYRKSSTRLAPGGDSQSWKWAGFSANLTARYANGYYDNETLPVTRVGSWTTVDLRVAYTFGSEDAPMSHPTEAAVYGKNLACRYPRLSRDVVGSTGYDQESRSDRVRDRRVSSREMVRCMAERTRFSLKRAEIPH